MEKRTSNSTNISVIIPAWNEEANILRAIASAGPQSKCVEVIVVDGESSDGTVDAARRSGARVVSAPRGRGVQLNVGARAATGNVLLFLHADSALPLRYFDSISEQLQRPIGGQLPQWGCFQNMSIERDGWAMRLLELTIGLRTRFLHVPYGDQGIFIRSSAYHALQGFKDWPLLEDYEMVLRLRMLSPPALVQDQLTVNGRRWDKLGIVATTVVNQCIIAAYHFGASPETLAGWYYKSSGLFSIFSKRTN